MNKQHKVSLDTTLQSISLLSSVIVLLLGLTVLTGWYIHNITLVQILPLFVPMQYNTALGFVLSGIALFSVVFGWLRTVQVSTAIIVLIATLTLIEYLFSVDLKIDQLFMEHYITTKSFHPGRMSSSTAICFLIAGTSLLMLSIERFPKWRFATIAAMSSLMFAAGAGTLIGYAIGQETPFGWEHSTYMALHTAIGFTILGLGIFAITLVREKSLSERAPGWLPIPVALVGLIIVLAFTHAFQHMEDTKIKQEIATKSAHQRIEIKNIINLITLSLTRMAHRWEIRGGTPQHEWETDAINYISHRPMYQTLMWVDSSYRVRWVVPQEGSGTFLNIMLDTQENNKNLLDSAKEKHSFIILQASNFVEDENGIFLIYPLFIRGAFDGFIMTQLNINELLKSVVEQAYNEGFAITISESDHQIYQSSDIDLKLKNNLAQTDLISFQNIQWQYTIWPTDKFRSLNQSFLPQAVFVVGFIIILLLTTLTRLIQQLRLRQTSLASLNTMLQGEIAERKKTEVALREIQENLELQVKNRTADLQESKEQIELLLNSTAESIYGTDTSGKCIFCNPACVRILGFKDKNQLLGKYMHELIHHTYEDGRPYPKEKCQINKALREGKLIHVDNESLWRADGTSFPAEYWSYPIFSNEKIEGGVVTFFDITERKSAEREIKQFSEKLSRSNAELQQFAYVASHDLQEPLRGISGCLQILKRRYESSLDERANELIRHAVEGAVRLQTLIQDLLAFSRVETMGKSFKSVSSDKAVQTAMINLKTAIDESGANIKQNELPDITADYSQLILLFQNLIGNAIKYQSNRKPEIRISVKVVDNMWQFSVKDNGIGFEEEYRDRIFEIFQRLHSRDEYKGTGIGLAICKRIVKRHGGHIWAESKPGKGTTIFFTLPKQFRQTKAA